MASVVDLTRDLKLVHACLLQAGVNAVFIKGVAFAAQVGADPAARRSRDIDVLVARADVRRAIKALEELGYVAKRRLNGLAREVHLVHGSRACVDLHWNLAGSEVPFPFDFRALWRERGAVGVDETDLPVPSPPWLLVFACFCTLRIFPVVEPRYVLDVARVLPLLDEPGWRRAAELAETTRTRRICGIVLHLAAAIEGVALPSMALHHFPADDRVRQGVAETAASLASGRVEKDEPITSELRRLLVAGRYRESGMDRLWPWLVLPGYFLVPDATDAARAAAAGHGLWRARLSRVPEVVETLRDELHRLLELRRFRRRLASRAVAIKPRADLALFFLDDEALLLEPTTETLVRLETPAAYVWCALEEGALPGAIEDALVHDLGFPAATASVTLESLMQRWYQLGLLDEPRLAPKALIDEPPARERRLAPIEPHVILKVRMLDQVFGVALPDAATRTQVEPLLRHLATDESPSRRLAVQQEEGAQGEGFVILLDGVVVETSPSLEALGPQVKSALTVAAINAYGFALYVHAAMLRPPGSSGVILLPAAAGSGKTCLSAALAAAGYAYHTDEVTLLAGPSLDARGIPVCLTVKEPAWPVLADRHPALANLAIHQRVDGKICKYLPPPIDPADPALAAEWPVVALVFPRYSPDVKTRLSRLPRLDALGRLLEQCLAIRLDLDAATVGRLVDWIAAVEVYELTFADLDSAVSELAAVFDGVAVGPGLRKSCSTATS
jgi:hypothetical protein